MSGFSVDQKNEVTRLAKKANREQLESLHSTSSKQRKELAELKQGLARLRKDVGQLRREIKRSNAATTAHANAIRFQARGLRSLRSRLGLSADHFGKLVGVSGQTIYNWETQKSTPNTEQLAKLVKLRSMGKKEAHAAIESLRS